MTIAFTFPGQGSQFIGMGRELTQAFPSARHVFEEIDEALGEKLSKIILEGPVETLTLTQNTQPALMAVSLAVTRALDVEFGVRISEKVEFVAGHSLGEYSALAAAGALGVADTARLLRLRGLAMQKAVPVGEGAMAALLGIDLAGAEAAAAEGAEGEVCSVANDNADGQVVISGNKAAVERAIEIAKAKGSKRAMLLPVSAPFHCALMQPAADAMAEALKHVVIRVPAAPVVANVTASAVSDPEEIKRLLVSQVTGVVRWRECVLYMAAQGVDRLVELGAGKVLTGMVKRIHPDVAAVSLQTPADLEEFAKSL
jgi:[acyl-carrier-protein] S-malonyltransferase